MTPQDPLVERPAASLPEVGSPFASTHSGDNGANEKYVHLFPYNFTTAKIGGWITFRGWQICTQTNHTIGYGQVSQQSCPMILANFLRWMLGSKSSLFSSDWVFALGLRLKLPSLSYPQIMNIGLMLKFLPKQNDPQHKKKGKTYEQNEDLTWLNTRVASSSTSAYKVWLLW